MKDCLDHLRDQLRPHIVNQKALSRATGIAQANISAWLAGRRPMPLGRIAAIAAALGLELQVELRPGATKTARGRCGRRCRHVAQAM